jgi:ElaB/YqjD/DUF883 family membrane-anchored ribosome-binding protein
MQNGALAKLVTDFKVLIDDAEGLIKASATEAGSRIGGLRHRLEKRLEDRKSARTTTTANKTWLETVEDAKMQTESYLREHAWAGLLLAVGVGALLGMLVRRK